MGKAEFGMGNSECGKDRVRGKMDEGRKENKRDQNRQRSEGLSQSFTFIPLLSGAVILRPSVFLKRSAPPTAEGN